MHLDSTMVGQFGPVQFQHVMLPTASVGVEVSRLFKDLQESCKSPRPSSIPFSRKLRLVPEFLLSTSPLLKYLDPVHSR